MSFLVWGAAATVAGAAVKTIGAGVKGYQAHKAGKDTAAQAENAEQIRQDEIALANRESALTLNKNKSAFQLTMEGLTNQVGQIGSKGNTDLFSAALNKDTLSKRSGFASSGEVESSFRDMTTSVRSGVESNMEDLALKSKSSASDYMSTIEGVSISKEKSLAAINERFTQRIGEIGATADTFKEGIFGSDNKIKDYDYNSVT